MRAALRAAVPEGVLRLRPPLFRLGLWAAVGAGILLLGVGFAFSPWVTVGVALGGLLLFATIRWPLPVVGILLFLGPVDLAFLTGGLVEVAPGLAGLDMNGIRLVSVSAGLWLVVLLDGKLRELLLSRPVRWYLLFLAFAAVTVPFSVDPMEGARLLFKIAWPLLVFLIVAHPDRTRGQGERLVDWILIGGAVIVLVNPFYVWAGGYHTDMFGRLRIQGMGIHQNPFSFYLLFVTILALTRFAFRMQARYLLLALAAFVWIGLTLTRITFLAGFVALAAVGLYAGFVQRNRRMMVGVAAAVVVLVAASAPFVLERTFGHIPTVGQLWSLVRDPILLYQTVDLAGRGPVWAVLAGAWMGSPLLGLGLGSSSGIIGQIFPPDAIAVAHNEYLRLGTDVGLVGLVLVALAAWAWTRAAWRGGEWAFPALAGIVAWIVISLTDNALDYYAPFTQYVGFAVAMALTWKRGEPAATSAGDPGAGSPPREAPGPRPRR